MTDRCTSSRGFREPTLFKVRESCTDRIFAPKVLPIKIINWNLITKLEEEKKLYRNRRCVFKRSFLSIEFQRNSKILTMERSCSYRWKLEDDPWRESFLVSPSLSSPLEIKRDKTTPSSPFLSILQHLCPFEIEDFPQSSIRLCYEPGRNSLMERTTLSIAGCAPRIFKEATIDDEEISGRGERVFPLNLLHRNLSFLLTVQLLECTCYRLLGGSNVKDDRFVSRWIFLLLDRGWRKNCLL